MSLICVLPYFSGDKPQAIALACWLRDLGGVKRHDCLLVIDEGTTQQGVIEPCREAFNSVEVIFSQKVESQGKWGDGTTDASGPNELFLTAAHYIEHKLKRRWFWLEADACPTRSSWLDEIEAEDKKGNKPFTGAYVNIPPHEPHLTGIAVYPPDVARHSLDMMMPMKIAWDYAGRKDTVEKGKAHFTDLIQHEYRIHGESPNFPTQESLSVIKPRTAVFHRAKSPDLIARLRERMSGVTLPIVATIPDEFLPSHTMGERENSPEVLYANLKTALARIQELEAELKKYQSEPAIADPAPKRGSKEWKRKPMTPERKEQLKAALAKAREAKKQKQLTGVK